MNEPASPTGLLAISGLDPASTVQLRTRGLETRTLARLRTETLFLDIH